MAYVLYNVGTTLYEGKGTYATERAAKAARTKLINSVGYDPEQLAIAKRSEFRKIEKQVTRTNLLSGLEYTESVNTPRCCSPASELYWAM